MRAAFIIVGDTRRMTGGYLYHARLLQGLRERGVEVEEIVPSGASLAAQREGAESLRAFDPRRFDVVVADALARAAVAPHLDPWREIRPVVSMIHELPAVAAGLSGEAAEQERRLEAPLLRADRIIAVSRHGREVLLGRGASADRIRVVPPGFDRLAAAGEPAPLPPDVLRRVLCVAQWIPRKGILELVRAWSSLAETGAVLELIGETEADPEYAARVREVLEAVPEDSVVVRGKVSDSELAAAYSSSSVFALPSRYEGYGMVYAEALSFGLPIIACSAGPVPELVGDAGLLVPPGEAAALSAALRRLLEDAHLRMRLSVEARRRASTLPVWEDTAASFLGVLKETIRQRA